MIRALFVQVRVHDWPTLTPCTMPFMRKVPVGKAVLRACTGGMAIKLSGDLRMCSVTAYKMDTLYNMSHERQHIASSVFFRYCTFFTVHCMNSFTLHVGSFF